MCAPPPRPAYIQYNIVYFYYLFYLLFFEQINMKGKNYIHTQMKSMERIAEVEPFLLLDFIISSGIL